MNVTEKITIEGKTYFDWQSFLLETGLKNRKSIYDWVKDGKAEVKKIGSAPFYRKIA